jgi:hypothetical protein
MMGTIGKVKNDSHNADRVLQGLFIDIWLIKSPPTPPHPQMPFHKNAQVFPFIV